MRWQPIETAPKDGTPVIVHLNRGTQGIVHIAWYRSKEEWEESGQYCGGWGDLADWEGWWTYPVGSVTQEKLDDDRTPTHWAPYNSPSAA
jgi:hypothetical protein